MQTVAADDLSIVRRCQEGDSGLYDELVLKHQDRIFNLVNRLVGNYDDACEITQDVFLKAFRALDRFHGRSSFYTWVFRIAVNTVRSFLRKTANRPKAVSISNPAGHAALDPPARSRDPSETAEARERRQAVEDAIAQLHEEQRVLVILRDIEGRDYAEIAHILGVPRGTVKSRLHRARTALKTILAPVMGFDLETGSEPEC